MAENALVSDDIRSGRSVIEAARRQGIPLQGAFWRHESDPDRWRLVLVSKEAEGGKRPLYFKMADAIDFDDLERLDFKPPSDKEVLAAEKAAGLIVEGEGVRVYSLLFDGRYVDEAFVYRL